MTTLDAMLRTICEMPGDDLPRLMYADAVEDEWPERAEFIRQPYQCCHGDASVGQACPWEGAIATGGLFCPTCEVLISFGVTAEVLGEPMLGGDCHRYTVRHGFLDSIRLDWPTFLRVEAALIWTPGQTVECPECKAVRSICEECGATGRVPRPFPPTSQPITGVTLTTWPISRLQDNFNERTMPYITSEGHRITRVKCQTCGDSGRFTDHPPENWRWASDLCPQCGGAPLNEWHCDKWPGVTFVMPTTDGVAAVYVVA